MRPVIAVSTPIEELDTPFGARDCTKLAVAYTDAVYRTGGRPAILPVTSVAAGDLLAGFDGLVLTGGGDLDPALYGEQPDPNCVRRTPGPGRVREGLVRRGVVRGRPVLAICRGMQLINVLRGGSLIQQIEDEIDHWQTAPSNDATPKIEVAADSQLGAVFAQLSVGVNSSHHQALNEFGTGLRVVATCGAATAFRDQAEGELMSEKIVETIDFDYHGPALDNIFET